MFEKHYKPTTTWLLDTQIFSHPALMWRHTSPMAFAPRPRTPVRRQSNETSSGTVNPTVPTPVRATPSAASGTNGTIQRLLDIVTQHGVQLAFLDSKVHRELVESEFVLGKNGVTKKKKVQLFQPFAKYSPIKQDGNGNSTFSWKYIPESVFVPLPCWFTRWHAFFFQEMPFNSLNMLLCPCNIWAALEQSCGCWKKSCKSSDA